MAFLNHFAQNDESALDAGGVHIAVRDKSDGIGRGVERPDTVRLEGVAQLEGFEAGCLAIEDDDVCLHFVGIDLQGRDLGDAFSEPACVLMINVQPLGRFLQGDAACGGEDPNLAHAAAEHLAVNAGFVYEFLRANDHGANWGAQALGEAEHNRVEISCHCGHVDTEGNGGIEDARAVEMDSELGSMGARADFERRAVRTCSKQR